MSHTTTATITHDLTKYSRSYPSNKSNPEKQVMVSDPEWQHFVNPTIQLILDVKKSPSGDLESVRLRILWLLNSGIDAMATDATEVTFEDLDLLAFSSMKSQKSTQGLPLKAVYRDSVVGLRYLYPLVPSSTVLQDYRRFQVTFISDAAASQFINVIQNVCPCKVNPSPVGRAMTMKPPTVRLQPAVKIHALNSSNPTTTAASLQQALVQPTWVTPARLMAPQSSPLPPSSPNTIRYDTTPVYSSSLNLGSSSQPSGPSLAAPALNLDASQQQRESHFRLNSNLPIFETANRNPVVQRTSDDSALPEPSPTTSSVNSDFSKMAPPPLGAPKTLEQVSHHAGSAVRKHPLMDMIQQSTNLYDLPRADLEKLVSHIIREEGFLKLLDNLDSLWRLKGLLPH